MLRILPVLGDHVLTAELEKALAALADKLYAAGRNETALAVENARLELAQSVEKLNLRATRLP